MEKLEWWSKKFEDKFTRFNTIHECNRQTDRLTPHNGTDHGHGMHSVTWHKPISVTTYVFVITTDN